MEKRYELFCGHNYCVITDKDGETLAEIVNCDEEVEQEKIIDEVEKLVEYANIGAQFEKLIKGVK